MRSRLFVLVLFSAGLVACVSPPADKPVVGRMSALPAVAHPADNPTSPAKVALGAQLFMDKRLSGSGNNNCQSCHYRELGWTDANVLSKRDNGDLNTRHTPSLYNVGHQSIWYWDGRAATMEAQTLAAWRNQMSVDPAVAAARINAQAAAAAGGAAGGDKCFLTLMGGGVFGNRPFVVFLVLHVRFF